jgi:hypothetical protein
MLSTSIDACLNLNPLETPRKKDNESREQNAKKKQRE